MWTNQEHFQPTTVLPPAGLWIVPVQKESSSWTTKTKHTTMRTSVVVLVSLGILCISACVLAQIKLGSALNQCFANEDCTSQQTCMNLKCKDPCLEACNGNTVCQVRNHVPYCACKPGFSGDPFSGCDQRRVTLEPQCETNDDCPQYRACINRKCEDPCYDVCRGNTTTCHVRNHIPYCTCRKGFSGDPSIACKPQNPPGSWPPYPGAKKRFQLELIKTNWFGAFAHCLNHGGRLATVANYEENERVKEAIRKTGLKASFWGSGTDYALGNHWTWVSTGLPFTFTDWSNNQPDNWQNLPGGEHCLEFWEETQYRWNDRNCLEQQYSVCEYYDEVEQK
ncbi:asialoglycoprotein receptor 2-like [Homalodisca vitripennis]|uniref:asialoglycoprotein receptor 2-like n=1 Tax=Homalodisca vitripennis TaxID=197043 RepID=UPI001EEA2F5A|nr:asialoglycoprotein receptor 2-like [Homalodisca vitripennis]